MLYSDEYINNGKKFDVLKIVLAVLIVCVHCTPRGFWYRPLLRVAVPLFFLMTSYFFFHKQKECSSIHKQKELLKKYVKRTIKLYLFWFVLLLPLTIVYRKWYVDFNIYTPLIILRDFFLGSTFKGSWFLMACIVNIAIVWRISKIISYKWLFLIGIVSYIFCCCASNYHAILVRNGLENFYNIYKSLFHSPYNSFPVGFLFVVVGKYLSEKKIYVAFKTQLIILLFSLILIQFEANLIKHFDWSVADDCFLTIIPLSIILFLLIGQQVFNIKCNTKPMRELSVIMYCSHISIVPIVGLLLVHCGIEKGCGFYNTLLICLIILFCLLIGFLIISFRDKYTWLKNAY